MPDYSDPTIWPYGQGCYPGFYDNPKYDELKKILKRAADLRREIDSCHVSAVHVRVDDQEPEFTQQEKNGRRVLVSNVTLRLQIDGLEELHDKAKEFCGVLEHAIALKDELAKIESPLEVVLQKLS